MTNCSRLEFLKKIRDKIDKTNLTQFRYYENGCYCAVGVILKEKGIDDDTLYSFKSNTIRTVANGGYLDNINNCLTLEELDTIQALNDGTYIETIPPRHGFILDLSDDNKDNVLYFIDLLIKEEEEKC